MEIVLNANSIIGIAGLISAIGALITLFVNSYRTVDRWNKYGKEIKKLKKEQYMQTYVLEAVLDGLHQLGCNGKTTEASNKLHEYMNATTHEIDED